MEKSQNNHEYDVLDSLGPVVQENLRYLTNADQKKWWPAQFFSFMNDDDYFPRLQLLREQARGLDDELLIVLIGDMVTEEALPSYAIATQSMARDATGVSENPWAVWQRGWCAEENQHGDVLHQYLLLSGRVNMEAVDRSTYSLIKNGFRQAPGPFKKVFYPMFQEPATRVSHVNVAKIAKQEGVESLAEMCRRISGDEHRHGKFYMNVGKGVFDEDPQGAMVQFYELMKEGIVMPAHLMTDGIYTSPPTLFDNFANVALAKGVYTPFDYAEILETLNRAMDVCNRSVHGEAADAQEKLSLLPDRIRKVGERRLRKKRSSVQFDWLHGREV